ncbi:MAG: hypothetical protein GY796_07285 [Chloroflexi bacterium]|nr:hypothetical protein [Chloroflexota bacterium]
MRDWTKGKYGRLIIVLILLLAFGLRFYLLDAQSFWNDEGNSARLSERPISLIIEGTASDIHPPLYYLLLHGWQQLAGVTEFSLRSFSAFTGILTVAIVAAIGKQLSVIGHRSSVVRRPSPLAITAALLTAVNPALIYYSQETRMYALLGLLAVGSTWCLLNWVTAARGSYSVGRYPFSVSRVSIWEWAMAYVFCAAAGLYTHYFFPAVLVAHTLIIFQLTIVNYQLSIDRFRLFLSWAGMMLATFLLYAPWLPTFVQQFGADDLSGRTPFLSFLFTAIGWMAFGSTIALETVTWAVAAVSVLLLLGIWHGRRQTIPALILLITPIGFMFAAATMQPQFFKFLLVTVPFFCLLLAAALTMGQKWTRLIAAILLLIALPLGTIQSLQNLYGNPDYGRADYRSMAVRIQVEAHPNAGIILNAPNQWEVFTYYYPDEAAVYPLPKGHRRPQAEEIATALSEIAARHDRLYAIFWGEAQRDPERLIERWLDEHAFKASDNWIGDVRFVTYAVPQTAATEMETAVNLPVGDSITLIGYTQNEVSNLKPGDILQLTLFWQTAVPLEQRTKVFLHLIGPDGQLVTQRDSEPGGALKPTNAWPPNETIVDNHGLLLPTDLPPGKYTLLLGMYDIADPNGRLPIQTESEIIDAWTVTTFAIENNLP